MPPSENQLYAGKFRRFSTKVHKDFKSTVESWANMNQIAQARAIAAKYETFRVERHFHWPKTKIRTKSGKIRVFDVANRIKAVDDAVFKLLGIDDCRIFEGTEKKCEGDMEFVNYLVFPIGNATTSSGTTNEQLEAMILNEFEGVIEDLE